MMPLAVWAVFALMIAWGLNSEYERIDSNERERVSTQARVVHDALSRQLQATQSALMSVRTDLPFLIPQRDSTEFLSRRLQSLSDVMQGVRTLSVLNDKGVVSASNRPELIGRDFSARAYFALAKESNDPDKLYVSTPFKTVLGVYSLNLVKVLHSDKGAFAGIISATIDADFSADLLKSVRYEPTAWTALVHGSGTVVNVSPANEAMIGMDLTTPGSLFSRHLQSGQAVNIYRDFSKLTQEDSFLAVHSLQPEALNMDVPLIIGAGRSFDDAYSAWHRGLAVTLGAFALASMLAALALWKYQQQKRALDELARQQNRDMAQSLENLRQSESFAREIADNIPGLFAFWRADFTCGYANKSYLEWFGKTQAEMQGISIQALLGDVLFQKNALYMAAALRGEPQQFERALVKADGSTGYTWTQYLPFRVDGQTKGFFALVTDITELRASQEQQRLNDLSLKAISQSVIITDAKANIVSVNDSFVKITGYDTQEMIGRNCRFLQGPQTDPKTIQVIRQALDGGRSFSGEILNYRKDGTQFWNDLTIAPVRSEEGLITHFIGVTRDASERKNAEAAINTLAFYDPLTSLPNRRMLMDRMHHLQATSLRHPRTAALLFIDLDKFKVLNDTRGHQQGDLLLIQVAQRLSSCVRDRDTVARLGGDEFVVMLEDLTGDALEAASHARAVGEKILQALNQDYALTGFSHHCTPSIGITLFGDVAESVDEPLKRADIAMYQAKAAGRNTLRFFDPQIQQQLTQHTSLEARLTTALTGHQFVLYYQPQVQGLSEITGVEALLRWREPELGMISPGDFIPVAEETGLILPIGAWVLQAACMQLATWAHQPARAHLSMAVNVSAKQLQQDDFVAQVLRTLEETAANPKRLKLEITESMLLNHIEDVIAKMTALKAVGVGFSLDDFGTGYSSLAYLKRLPLDQLKIDQGFVRDILVDPNDAAIAKMIIVLSESLGLTVIAEGVEAAAQRDFLISQGCHGYQGYFFSRPMPVAELEAYLHECLPGEAAMPSGHPARPGLPLSL
jgi:diguanylate cyclase (GGDEF)-like protein/PAS domain S-box-containing protein